MVSEKLFNLAEMDVDLPEIDLHGFRLHEAEVELDSFLNKLFVQKERIGKVIHGRGSGQLQSGLSSFLKSHKLVKDIRASKNSHEIGAVLYFLLNL